MKRIITIVALLLAGCSGSDPQMPGLNANPPSASQDHDPDAQFLAGLPTGADQLKALCSRGHQDLVSRGLCASPTPSVLGLSDLQHAVGLFSAPQPPQFALTGHSTSLIARSVSALNPRAIIFTPPSGQPTTQQNDGTFIQDPGFVAMGFARGEQVAELVAHDPQQNQLNFYLVKFTQKCNTADQGCTPGDLLTPAIESGWQSVTVYDDEDLKNTVFDCRMCHQPGGPQTMKMLRMQERRAPWDHWFRNNKNEPGGVALLQDFQSAHGDEDYAGIPGNLISTPRSDPLVLEALIDNNTVSPQPNEFNSAKIEQQIQQQGFSSTWQQLYNNFASGQDIPPPYHDIKITDPTKLANMTAAYAAVRLGQAPASSLPDIRNVVDDGALSDLGWAPSQGASGQQILVEMCQRCHNSSLDQSISRGRFNVEALASMSMAEKQMAINRLQAAPDAKELMPPARFGQLSAAEIQLAVQALSQ